MHRAWRQAKERRLEQERKLERGRPFGLDLNLFDE